MSTAHPHAQLQQCSGLELHHPPSQRKQNKQNDCSPGLQKIIAKILLEHATSFGEKQACYWETPMVERGHTRSVKHGPLYHISMFSKIPPCNLLLRLQGGLSPNLQLSHNIMELICLEMMHYGILFSMGRQLKWLQYKAVVITSLVVEQHCVVYKINIAICLSFTTYFNRRLGVLAIFKCIYAHVTRSIDGLIVG